MKPAPFEYCRPESLDEALAVLLEFGDEALVMAGGLSLGALLNMRMVRPKVIVDINGLEKLAQIERVEDYIRIGALVRQVDVLVSAECGVALPLLIAGMHHLGHYQTRSRGTLGGSVAHADPSAETPLCLATLGGEVELSSKRGVRRIVAREFFKGALTTAREGDEMVTASYWPILGEGTGIAFEEINERRGDFAIVAAAAWARREGGTFRCGLGLGGVEDCPVVQVENAEGATEEIAERMANQLISDLEPMDDRRASAEYRRHLAFHLGQKVMRHALEGVVQ
jgi:2-furoyl-CoA dehydrogenase FAD binding subunit